MRSFKGGRGIALVCLRAAAIVLLALVLLQPVLRFVHRGRQKRTLALFIDTSESMSVADTGISPARAEELIRGLRLRGKVKNERAPEDLRARVGELLEALEELAAPGEEIRDWRAGLESVRKRAAVLSRALGDVDTERIPASDRAVVETAAFLQDEFGRFEMERGESDSQAAGRLKWLAQDVLPAAKKLAEQLGWLERALAKRARRDAVASEARVRSVATESTRLELALRALTSEKLGVLEELAGTHDLRAFRLSETAEHLDLVRGGEPVGLDELELDLKPTGEATDLAGSVLAGVNEVARASGDRAPSPIAGVVVLSDGRQTVKGSPLDAAAALGARGIPVYAVGVGSAGKPRDAAIAELRAPESVFKGDRIEIEVALAVSGIDLESREERVPARSGPRRCPHVPVSLTEGPRTLEIKTAAIENGTGRVAFEVPTETPGIRRFTLSIPEFELESTLGNNSREAVVKVAEDKLRVTVVYEYPRWELRFIRNLIWRSRKMELDVVSFVEEPARAALGRTREEIMKSSVLVLDDVAAGRFSREDGRNLVEFVSRRGGTIVMIAGPEHLPSEYVEPPLSELLPFKRDAGTTWRVRGPGEEPFTFALTPEGAAEPFVRLAEEADDLGPREGRAELWARLPGFFEYVAAGEVAPGTKVLLKVRQTGDPLLMVRRYGLGKVIFLAMHETWRWRYKVADRDHGRFWGSLLRYAGEEPFAVKDRFVSLDTDRTIYSPGEPIHVRARVLGTDGLPLLVPEDEPAFAGRSRFVGRRPEGAKDLVCVLERKPGQNEDAEDADDLKRVIRRPLEAAIGGGGIYRAAFGAVGTTTLSARPGAKDRLPAGEYTVRIESPRLDRLYAAADGAFDRGKAAPVTLDVSIRPDVGGELVDTSFSEETLAGMARASFGRYFDISQIAELPEAVGKGWEERTRVTAVELWSSYYVYALVLALLTAEWILRKRLGLA